MHFALPILYANALQSLNGSVNSIWVGRFLGEAALTATANANVVMFLLIGFAFGIAMAATILVGQRIGANDIRGARHAVGTSATTFRCRPSRSVRPSAPWPLEALELRLQVNGAFRPDREEHVRRLAELAGHAGKKGLERHLRKT